MKTKSIIVAGLAALVVVMPAARAAVLNFEGAGVCNTTADGNGAVGACGDWVYISQSYGDVAGMMDVQYSAPRYTDTSLEWWANDYNSLYAVAWAPGGDGNSKARIDLKSLNGQAVTLTHFDMGAYANTTRGTTITISDLSGNVLMSYVGNVGEAGNMPTAFNGSWTGMTGVRIEWEDSAYNVGIDNVTYQQIGAPVPEPETYAMLGAGLAMLGALARRRRKV